jgi:hypothetical protein
VLAFCGVLSLFFLIYSSELFLRGFYSVESKFLVSGTFFQELILLSSYSSDSR